MTVASLNAGLLARKGDARPSVISHQEPWPSRAGSQVPGQPTTAASVGRAGCASAACGGEPSAAAQAADARRDRHGRVRLSVRLDGDRHRRLRLAALLTDSSIQDLLTDALDARLDALALDCPCIRESGRAGPGGEGAR